MMVGIYTFPHKYGSDGGYDYFWGNDPNLIRLNLEKGYWVNTRMGRAYSFSPDDKYLAYRSADGIRVNTLGTNNEKVISVPEKYLDYGRITWSPDSRKIIFVATEGDLMEKENGFSAFLIDLEKSTLVAIFEDNMRYIYPIEWRASRSDNI